MAGTRPQVVLFDLGGVLIRLAGVSAMQELAGIDDEAEVWRRWLSCEWVRRFERGQCAGPEFASGVVADWDLPVTAAEFLESFRNWPDGLHEGAVDLVATVRRQAMVGCLSNTNSIHWTDQAEWGLAGMFDVTFLSYQLGLVKPDPEIFDHVASELGVDPTNIFFLDDNAINVEQAVALGFDAVRVQGVDEARGALADRGFARLIKETSENA
jgi:putative hydrolase of the HAD superfamily